MPSSKLGMEHWVAREALIALVFLDTTSTFFEVERKALLGIEPPYPG